MIDVVYYLFNSLRISSKPGRLMLPKWVEISEKWFNEILCTVSLLKDLGNEFKNRYNDIVNDAETIADKPTITRNRKKIAKIMSLLREIIRTKFDEQPDTTDMPELESEESAAERRNQPGKGLKILTPDQMLSRLPISLAQLKAGNNSEKLKNEIRQLLYSLYRSKKLTKQLYTKQLYKSLIDII